ncbi:[FeFe] hydrogenase H-cluster maturation GTPase HydF [Scatolibacter rhodanostii]|uniref:[FeFe] hydrogenase H-cluster maturation GTPase HydF n=1 Tax=Scatolibacter rhodanostii TaxID=2014781 RepID=UPI001356579D|nr:[FeFe] hydrogenase H-cluster maturation GTPase HydF [Scatolibacter rhodanostii]
MEKTPNSMRRHVAIFGKTNAGKSTIFNALTGQQNAIVSPQAGTTTDPVQKAMELIPFGPIVMIDTAGLSDETALGQSRMQKTKNIMRRADFALYIVDATDYDSAAYEEFCQQKLLHLLVFNKWGLLDEKTAFSLKESYSNSVPFIDETSSTDALREKLAEELAKLSSERSTFLGDLLPKGSVVILVMPVDSEAPKGRLILPQVQILRDCLDNNMIAACCQVEELAETIRRFDKVDLVVTDSQAFAAVNQITPPTIALTSFSILVARQKGSISELVYGSSTIENLKDGDRILMLEGCTHNSTHEDIGRVKIPNLLRKKTGKKLDFDYFSGYQFPDSLDNYALAIQCGGCMLNETEIKSRIRHMNEAGLPVTNYGMCLAILSGAWNRCKNFLEGEWNEHSANE